MTNGKPIPFPAGNANVPIIGQPFTVKSAYVTALIVCACAAHEPVLLVAGSPGTCPSCKRGFVLQVKGIEMGVGLVAQAPENPAS